MTHTSCGIFGLGVCLCRCFLIIFPIHWIRFLSHFYIFVCLSIQNTDRWYKDKNVVDYKISSRIIYFEIFVCWRVDIIDKLLFFLMMTTFFIVCICIWINMTGKKSQSTLLICSGCIFFFFFILDQYGLCSMMMMMMCLVLFILLSIQFSHFFFLVYIHWD